MNDLASAVGRRITLRGTARNAHAGAVLVTDEGAPPLYVEGTRDWGPQEGTEVEVTGTLLVLPPTSPGQEIPVRHGIPEPVYVLRNPTIG